MIKQSWLILLGRDKNGLLILNIHGYQNTNIWNSEAKVVNSSLVKPAKDSKNIFLSGKEYRNKRKGFLSTMTWK